MGRIERFSVGSIDCQILPDGIAMYSPADLAAGVPAAQVTAALGARVNEKGEVAVPYNCLLIRSGGRIALVDTGLGAEAARQAGEPTGRLMESLTVSGITADQVDVVVISHAPPDHIGGLTVDGDGGRVPVFGAARHYFWHTEWEYWTSEEELAQVPEDLADPARTHLPPVHQAGLVELVSEETDVLPGVRLLPAPGHTPGHMALTLTSGQDGAIYLGDAIVDEMNFEHPDWVSAFESIPNMTVTTRKALIEKAIRENRLMVAFHIAARGYAERTSGNYRLRHVGAEVQAAG
jgi:glyoxylase-like metal-dependent hydrolase (beta-lactamase superfamily II)